MSGIDRTLLVPASYPESPYAPDPDFTRAAEWLSRGGEGNPSALVLGAPMASLSISGAHCDKTPAAVRAAMWTFSTYFGANDRDLQTLFVEDLGDVRIDQEDPDNSLRRIEQICSTLPAEPPLVLVGGDNSITAPAVTGLVGKGGAVLTLDAHHDLRDYRRSGLSSGSPIRVLLDQGVEGSRIWQLGIRDFANSPVHAIIAADAGITVIDSSEIRLGGIDNFVLDGLDALSSSDGIYVDIDVDVVDRAFAPGAPAAQPGGLLPSDVTRAAYLCGVNPRVVAMDVVEVDPDRDLADTTVRLAALVILSFLAGVAERNPD